MQIMSSYEAEIIRSGAEPIGQTEKIYRDAVSYLIDFYSGVRDCLSTFETSLDRSHAAERLVHKTRKNTPVADFDEQFPKMPSY